MIRYLLGLFISGLIVGALGRLAIPGPNPMSLPMTALVGVGGMLIGGLIGAVLFGRSGGLILGVLCSAAIVYFMQRREVGAGPRRDPY